MQVLEINSHLSHGGGPQSYMAQVSAMLRERGHQVRHFGMADEESLNDPDAAFYVSRTEPLRVATSSSYRERLAGAGRAFWSREAGTKMAALVDRYPFDLAHVHYIRYELSPSILPRLKAKGIPIVHTVHDYSEICPRGSFYSEAMGVCEKCRIHRYYHAPGIRCIKGSLSRSLYAAAELTLHKMTGVFDRNIDAYIFPSQFMLEKYVEYGTPRERAVLLRNFVSTAEPPSREDAGYALYLGGLRRLKGVYTLLEAAAQLPSIPLLIVGGGEEYSGLQAVIEKQRLSHVKLCGYMSGAGLREVVSKARFTLVPSECYENCPMVALEAFALGKPVIGARIGGIPELIEDGVTGLLFESSNAGDLAEKMAKLFSNPDRARAMGLKARRRAEVEYGAQEHYEGLMRAFEMAKRLRHGD